MATFNFWIFLTISLVPINGNPQKIHIVDSHQYYPVMQLRSVPSYSEYLGLMFCPATGGLDPLIRQPCLGYPGDYFWPADALIPDRFIDSTMITKLSTREKGDIEKFLVKFFSGRFPIAEILDSLRGYEYNLHGTLPNYPEGHRREAYSMFTVVDTVYVISTINDRFISLYQAVPGKYRLSKSELSQRISKLTMINDILNVDRAKSEVRSDPLNYYIQILDFKNLIRVRNYQLFAKLPPSAPSSKAQFYNLIEFTQVLDSTVIKPVY